MRQDSYRELLYDEYQTRKSVRPEFSLNSFARFVGLTSSHLNDVLKKRRGLSTAKAYEIVDKLRLSDFESSLFITSVRSEHSRSKKEREVAEQELQSLKQQRMEVLKSELFNMVSRWLDMAILELIRTTDFQFSAQWIAKELDVSENAAEGAMNRLLTLGLIKKENEGYRSHSGFLSTTNDVPSQAIRNHHMQILEKAKQAVQSMEVEKRECQSAMVAIDQDDLPIAKKLIRDFQKEFCQKLTRKPRKRDSVFNLTMHFFPISRDKDV